MQIIAITAKRRNHVLQEFLRNSLRIVKQPQYAERIDRFQSDSANSRDERWKRGLELERS